MNQPEHYVYQYVMNMLVRGKVSQELIENMKKASNTDDIGQILRKYLSVTKESDDTIKLSVNNKIKFSFSKLPTFYRFYDRIKIVKLLINAGYYDEAKFILSDTVLLKDIKVTEDKITIYDKRNIEIVVDNNTIEVKKKTPYLTLRQKIDISDRNQYFDEFYKLLASIVYSSEESAVILNKDGYRYRYKTYDSRIELLFEILKNEGFNIYESSDSKYYAYANKVLNDGTNINVKFYGNHVEITYDAIENDKKVTHIYDFIFDDINLQKIQKTIKEIKKEDLSYGEAILVYLYYFKFILESDKIPENEYHDFFGYADIAENKMKQLFDLYGMRNLKPYVKQNIEDFLKKLVESDKIKIENNDIKIFDTPVIETLKKYEFPYTNEMLSILLEHTIFSSPEVFLSRNPLDINFIENLIEKGYLSPQFLLAKIGDKQLWDYLSSSAKKTTISRLASKKSNLKILTNLVNNMSKDDILQYAIFNVCNGNFPALCTQLAIKYLPHIIGVDKAVGIKIHDDAIEYSIYYIQVSKLGYKDNEYVIWLKDIENSTPFKVVKARKIFEVLEKLNENNKEDMKIST